MRQERPRLVRVRKFVSLGVLPCGQESVVEHVPLCFRTRPCDYRFQLRISGHLTYLCLHIFSASSKSKVTCRTSGGRQSRVTKTYMLT